MIDKIALTQLALASLRARGTLQTGAPSAVHPSLRLPTADAGKTIEASWQDRLRRRIAHIDPRDPQYRGRALHAIVETCLIREFGNALEADPAFHVLVQDVTQTMQNEPQLNALIDIAVRELRHAPMRDRT